MLRKNLTLTEINLSYLEWYQGQKKPLLCLHGLADQGLVWSSLADYLAPNYHIIAPDLRGHGESSKPERGYSFDEIIADLEALCQDLGWQKINCIAHSWSAKLLTIWASKNPLRFESLILIDPFLMSKLPEVFKLTFPLLYKVLPFLKTIGPFPSYEAAEKIGRQLKQYRGWSPLQEKIFQTGIEQKSDRTWGSKFSIAARNQIFEEVIKVSGLTTPVNIPSLLIIPKQGINRTAWQLKPFKQYLTQLTIVEVPGNHWAFLVEPDIFNQTVYEFYMM